MGENFIDLIEFKIDNLKKILQGVANDVANYKTYWGTFQVRYFRVTGENLQFPRLKMQIVIISIGCLLCAVVFIMSMSILLEGFPIWQTSAYCKYI
jgi:gustatory receptor